MTAAWGGTACSAQQWCPEGAIAQLGARKGGLGGGGAESTSSRNQPRENRHTCVALGSPAKWQV